MSCVFYNCFISQAQFYEGHALHFVLITPEFLLLWSSLPPILPVQFFFHNIDFQRNHTSFLLSFFVDSLPGKCLAN